MPETKPTLPPKNIFTSPLKKETDKKAVLRKRNHRKAYGNLIATFLFLGAYSWFFFYPQLQDYLSFQQNLNAVNQQIEAADVNLSALRLERNLHKAAYDEEFKEEQDIIDAIFPNDPEKLEVIRLLEDYAAYLDATYGDFEFTSITFSKTEQENGYTVLPFQTSIHASNSNFDRFLGLINLSGSLEPESEHIRLMEISNITLRYRGLDREGKDQGVDFNVKLNAYSKI